MLKIYVRKNVDDDYYAKGWHMYFNKKKRLVIGILTVFFIYRIVFTTNENFSIRKHKA